MRAGEKEEGQNPKTEAEAAPAAPLALSIDWELYLRLLEDSDASEADKRALIECLWSIIVSFVDMGFRLNPLQEICGEPLPPPTAKAAPVLTSDEPSTCRTFADAAGVPPRQGRQA